MATIILELTEKEAKIYDEAMKKADETAVFLAGLSHADRLDWLKKRQYPRPISFEREIGGTVYTVNAHFSEEVFADIFPASAQLVTTRPPTFRTDETFRPALLKQICLAGFLRLEPLPEFFETDPFLLTHLRRHPSLTRLFYYVYSPIIRYYILGLVDLSR